MTARARKTRRRAVRSDADTLDTREWVADVARAHRLLEEIGPAEERDWLWVSGANRLPYVTMMMVMANGMRPGAERADCQARILARLAREVRLHTREGVVRS